MNCMKFDKRSFIYLSCILLLFFCTTLLFGKENRPGKTWMKSETEHFIFIHRDKDSPEVKMLVSFAEEVYGEVTAFFDYRPEKVRCLVLGETDAANGYFTPMPPHHIAVFAAYPTYSALGGKAESWLKLVFTHELTHFVHLTMDSGFLAGLSRIFGEPVKNIAGGFLPGWAIEGITVYLETALTAGGRGRNCFFELYYKAPIMENSFMSPEQTAYASPFPPPGRIYVAGYIITKYLMDHYGPDIFKRIHTEYLKFPFLGFYRALKKVTGQPFEEIFYRMKVELEEEYAEYRAFPRGTQVSPDVTGNYSLPVSTARGFITHRGSLFEPGALVRIDPETRVEEVLLKTSLTDGSSFSADARGTKIIFSSFTWHFNVPEDSRAISLLYLLDTDSGRFKELSGSEGMYHPAISPDGNRIVAVKRAGSRSILVTQNFGDKEWKELYAPEHAVLFNPVFDSTGENLAFVMNREGRQDVYLLSCGSGKMTGNPTLVPGPEGGTDYYPRFGPDGAVYFSSDAEGYLSIYAYHPVRKTLTHLYREQVGAAAGFPWQDGLLYHSYTSKGNAVKYAASSAFINREINSGTETKKAVSVSQNSKDIIDSKTAQKSRFRDFPEPAVWFPYPSLTDTGKMSPDIGIGIYTMGNTLLGKVQWHLSAGFHPSVLQPAGSFSLSFDFSPVNISYSLNQYYGSFVGGYLQATTQSLTLGYRPLERSRLDRTVMIQSGIGLLHSYRQFGSEDFSFFYGPSEHHYTAGTFRLSAAGIARRAPGDIFTRSSVSALAEGEIAFPILPPYLEGFTAAISTQATIPLGKEKSSIRFSLSADYITDSLMGRYPYRRLMPPGFTAVPRSSNGSLLSSISLRSTFIASDKPLFAGLNFLGLGGSFFIYKDFQYDLNSFSFSVARFFYPGFELTPVFGISQISVPVQLGVSFRIDPLFREPFDLEQDIMFFFTMNLPI